MVSGELRVASGERPCSMAACAHSQLSSCAAAVAFVALRQLKEAMAQASEVPTKEGT